MKDKLLYAKSKVIGMIIFGKSEEFIIPTKDEKEAKNIFKELKDFVEVFK